MADNIGESSRKKESDHSSDEGRPFKKAKYVWQLKGKYHLKKHFKKIGNSSRDAVTQPSEEMPVYPNVDENSNNNNEVRNENNNICSDRCCVDTLLARSNNFNLLESDDSNEQNSSSNNIDRSISEEIPVTLVKPSPRNNEEFLQKWQARQVAKSFVDNTINSILEHCNYAPYDAADFVENCENGEKLEDEGILMAIQSHGLQSTSGTTLYSGSANNINGESSRQQDISLRNDSISYIRPPELDESTLDNAENAFYECTKERSPDTDANEINIEMADQMDFLNAAVSIAIQKKGLSSYNYG